MALFRLWSQANAQPFEPPLPCLSHSCLLGVSAALLAGKLQPKALIFFNVGEVSVQDAQDAGGVVWSLGHGLTWQRSRSQKLTSHSGGEGDVRDADDGHSVQRWSAGIMLLTVCPSQTKQGAPQSHWR